MFSATDIALWFLAKNHAKRQENLVDDENYEVYEGITHLKLQKLLYYAQGIYLSCYGKRLFREDIVAWQHGPVVREVYDIYKVNGRHEINENLTDEEQIKMGRVEDDSSAKYVLELTYDAFACYTAWQLREKTHEVGTPWSNTVTQRGIDAIIDDKVIKEYFDENILEEE